MFLLFISASLIISMALEPLHFPSYCSDTNHIKAHNVPHVSGKSRMDASIIAVSTVSRQQLAEEPVGKTLTAPKKKNKIKKHFTLCFHTMLLTPVVVEIPSTLWLKKALLSI